MIRKCIYCFGSLVFVAFLLAIAAMTFREPTVWTHENRALAVLPSFPETTEDWQRLPEALEAWWSDRLYRRQTVVAEYNRFRMRLGLSPQHDVLVGKDGWLFLNKENVVDDFRNTRLFNEDELQRWRSYLLFRHMHAQQHGASYYFIVPPNKHTIYADFMPDHVVRHGDVSRLDQLLQVMAGSGVEIIDLRGPLLKARQEYPVYLKRDSHWNMMGANVAQHAILLRIREKHKDLPEPVLHEKDAFKVAGWHAFEAAEVEYYNGLSAMMGFGIEADEHQPLLKAHSWECVEPATIDFGPWEYLDDAIKANVFSVQTCRTGHYRVLMYRDSFSELLEPFFTPLFSLSVYIRAPRPLRTEWQFFIESLKPDIVLDETLERYLQFVPRPGADYPADFRPDNVSL